MDRPSILGVIPARLASTRLPDKPLHPVLGRPLILWVWERVSGMPGLDRVVVATDSEKVADVCRRAGAEVEMTLPAHPSGTDRVAEVAARQEFADYPLIVNIQGDEPLVREEHIQAAVEMVAHGEWEIGTCGAPIGTLESLNDPAVVKVARGTGGRALYFSRSPIPHKRDGLPSAEELGSASFLRHIGIYACTRRGLERWVALRPSPLEELERLEQLRPLEAGVPIGIAIVEGAEPGVDTPADVVRIEARLRAQGDPLLVERQS